MRLVRTASAGLLLAVLSVGATACASHKSSAPVAAAATKTSSSSGAPTGAKRGVVTIKMATVGDPGNRSVGVVQTFGGPKGKFVDPPKNTGI